jgi:TPR repeat protein
MLGWGFAFIALGVLSFVIPIFGRQFILVTLLGLSGMGSAVAGMVFLALGAALAYTALRREAPVATSAAAERTPKAESLPRRESIFSDGDDGMVITEKAFARADGGDANMQVLVGSAYLSGSNGLPQDPAKGFRYFLKAAQQGHSLATFVVAGLYADGHGAEINFDEARRWALRAKAAGNAEADQMLAAIDAKRSA